MNVENEIARIDRKVRAQIDVSYREALRHIGVDPYYEEKAAWAALNESIKNAAAVIRSAFGLIP